MELENIIPQILDYKINKIETTHQGDVSKVFKVTTEDSTHLIVKFVSKDEIGQYKKESYCYSELKNLDIPSPSVYNIGILDDQAYMVMDLVEGSSLSSLSLEKQVELYEQLGGIMLKVHTIKQGQEPEGTSFEKKNSFHEKYLPYNINSLNNNDVLLAKGIINESESAKLLGLFKNIENVKLDFGLTHGDLSLDNLILSEDKIYIIDWGYSDFAPVPFMEIVYLWQKVLSDNTDIKQAHMDSFIKGYGFPSSFIKDNLETMKGLLFLYLIDKMRWAIDHDDKEALEYYSTEYNLIKRIL